MWAQTIFNVIAILYPEMRVKFISASLILGIYTVLMIARPQKIINILKKSKTHHSITLTAKFINLFFIIFSGTILCYLEPLV